MTGALQRLLDDPKDFPQARLWVGDFYLGLRDYAASHRLLPAGRPCQPAMPRPKSLYETRNVLALLSEGKRDEAFRSPNTCSSSIPKDSAVLRMHADLLLDQGQTEHADLAVREFQKLATENPADATLRMQLGRAYRLKGDLESARAQFLEVIHQSHDLLAARYELAEIRLMQHRPQEAVQQASEILSWQPNDRRARLLYGSGLLAIGDGDAARAVFTGLIKDNPQDTEPQVQLGFLALAEKNFPQAIDILSQHRAPWGCPHIRRASPGVCA